MLKLWWSLAAAGIATVASVVAVAQAWGFYPIGVIVLLADLAVASLVVAAVAVWRATSLPTSARQRDARIVAEVRETLPRRRVEWFRDWDFGASWRADYVHPIYRLLDLNDAEHVPHDRRLRAALGELLDVAQELGAAHGQYSYPSQGAAGMEWQNVGWGAGEADGLGGEQRNLWEWRKNLLNELSVRMVDAYDDFIEIARDEHLLDDGPG